MIQHKIYAIGSAASKLCNQLTNVSESHRTPSFGVTHVNSPEEEDSILLDVSNSGNVTTFMSKYMAAPLNVRDNIKNYSFIVVSDDLESIETAFSIQSDEGYKNITMFLLGVELEMKMDPRMVVAQTALLRELSSSNHKVFPLSYHSTNALIEGDTFSMNAVLTVMAKWMHGFFYPLLNETRPNTSINSIYSTLFSNGSSQFTFPSFGEGDHLVNGIKFTGGDLGPKMSKDIPIFGAYVITSNGCDFKQIDEISKLFKYAKGFEGNCFVTLPNTKKSSRHNLITTIAVNTPEVEEFLKVYEGKAAMIVKGGIFER